MTKTTNRHMDDKQVRDEVLTLFLPGMKPPPTPWPGPFTCFRKTPKPPKQLRAELDSVLAGRAPAYTDLENCPTRA